MHGGLAATVAIVGVVAFLLLSSSRAEAAQNSTRRLSIVNVSASSHAKSHRVGLAVDGRLRTNWTAISGAYPQWFRIDLGKTRALDYVRIVWYGRSLGRTYDHQLQTSKNGKSWSAWTKGASARFVRIRVSGSSDSRGWASIREVAVYGRTSSITPAPTPAHAHSNSHSHPSAISVTAVRSGSHADSRRLGH